MHIFSNIFNSDRLPPVLVKEARQFVRSRLVVWVLLAELLGLAALSMIPLRLSLKYNYNLDDLDALGIGGRQLANVAVVLLAALVLAAFDSLLRSARERDEDLGDMLAITGLGGWRVAWGKLTAGWTLAALVLSVGIPFLMLAYLMRGISPAVLGYVVALLLEYAIMSVVLMQVLVRLPLPGPVRRFGGGILLVLLAFFPYGWVVLEVIRLAMIPLAAWAVLAVGPGAIAILLILVRFYFAKAGLQRIYRGWLSLLFLHLLFCLGFHAYWQYWPHVSSAVLSSYSYTYYYYPPRPDEVMAVAVGGIWSCAIILAILAMALECRLFWPRRCWRSLFSTGWLGGGVLLSLLILAITALNEASALEGDENDYCLLWTVAGVWLSLSAAAGWLAAGFISRKFQRWMPPMVMAAAASLFIFLALGIAGSAMGDFGSSMAPRPLLFISAVLLLVVLWGAVFLPPMPAPDSLSPEQFAARAPPDGDNDGTQGPEPTLKQRLFAEDWLTRPLSRLDGINPVFLKEFLQLWRSRTVAWMLWTLAGLTLASWLETLFRYGLGILEGDGVLSIGLYWGIILSPAILAMQQLNRSLREIDEQEMLFITALSPRTIRRGKTGSALVVCLAIGLPLQLAVLNLTSAFASLGKLGVCLLLLGMPAACVVLVTIGVAIAWSPLPAFHKRYLAPAILLLLSSPLILNSLGALSLHWLPDKFSQEWSLMTTLVWGIEARLWGILAWLMGWLVVWLIASQAADRWLLRRAAWKRN